MFRKIIEEIGIREVRRRFEEFVGAVRFWGSEPIWSVKVLPSSPHPNKGRNAVRTLVFVSGTIALSRSKSGSNIRHLLRFDHTEIFPGIDKRRKPVVCEDIWGNLLPYMMSCQ